MPDDIEFLTKPQIAVGLIDRALNNGVTVRAWTFDALYGSNGPFLNALEERRQVFVGEVPSTFHGWVRKPPLTSRPNASRKQHCKRRGKGGRSRKRKMRVKAGHGVRQVRNLRKHSPAFRDQSWQKYRIKDTHKGPEVWAIKWAVFWRKNAQGLPGRRHTLIVARNVLTGEIKYFVSNRVPGEWLPDNTRASLRCLLRVAFGRWSVESVFRETKEELGLDHYECRGWRCVHRHFYLTQLSHLFCARVRQAFDTSEPEQNPTSGRLSLEQVRSAMNVWLSSSNLKPASRREAYELELEKHEYHQRRNQQARTSHTKTRLERLAALGIDPDRIKSCIT